MATKNTIQQILIDLKEKYVFRFNMGNKKMEFRIVDETTFRDLTDIDLNSSRVELGLKGIACSKENLRSVIFSNQWERYDPYKEFLKKLPLWDALDHIHALAETVKTDEPTYWEWCLRKWLVAFVGSLADEQTVNQTALIFCGNQGIGKTTWFVNILPGEAGTDNLVHAVGEVKRHFLNLQADGFRYLLQDACNLLCLSSLHNGYETSLSPVSLLVGQNSIDLTSGQTHLIYAQMSAHILRDSHPVLCMVCVFPGLESTDCLLVRTLKVIAIDVIVLLKRTGRYRERLQTLLLKNPPVPLNSGWIPV